VFRDDTTLCRASPVLVSVGCRGGSAAMSEHIETSAKLFLRCLGVPSHFNTIASRKKSVASRAFWLVVKSGGCCQSRRRDSPLGAP
jgi:hypothetical protein